MIERELRVPPAINSAFRHLLRVEAPAIRRRYRLPFGGLAARHGQVMTASTPHGDALHHDGWTVLPSRLPAAFVERLALELDAVYGQQRTLQLRNGVGDGADGTVHHLPCAGGAFLDLLEADHGQGLLEESFHGPSTILICSGGLLNLPNKLVVCRPRPSRPADILGELHLMAQLLVMLDDFTEENGATYLLTGSHRLRDRPSDDVFFKDAARATGAAGSS